MPLNFGKIGSIGKLFGEHLAKTITHPLKNLKGLAEVLGKAKTLKSVMELDSTVEKIARFPIGLAGSVGSAMASFLRFMDFLEVLSPLLDVINALFDLFVGQLTAQLMPTFQKLFEILLSPTVMELISVLARLFGAILTPILEVLVEVLDFLMPYIKAFIGWLEKAIPIIKIIVEIIANVLIVVLKILANVFITIGNAVIAVVNFIIDAVNIFTAIVTFGLGGTNLQHVNYIPLIPLAEGGIVTKPTIALIGESGPEAVMPLDRGGGPTQEIHVHLTGGVYTTGIDDLASKVARKIELYKW